MKQLFVAALLALSAAAAVAAPWEGRRGGGDHPRGPQREQAADPWRGAPPQQPRRFERDERREGALSEEDRRGLHRDLDRANRELYRRR